MCVCTPHMQSKESPSASWQRGSWHGYRARFEYYGLRHTLYSREDNSLGLEDMTRQVGVTLDYLYLTRGSLHSHNNKS